MKKMPKKVVQALGQVAEETSREMVRQAGKVVAGVVTGKDLVGDIKPMSEKEMVKKQTEDEAKKQQEMGQLREKGRDVEGEMQKVREEKKKKEEEEERQFLDNIKRQREAEDQERRSMVLMVSSPGKRKKKRGSAFVKKGKGASQSEMSATSEYSRKRD